jgi:TldD protein
MNAPASPIPHFEIAEQTLLKPHGLAPHQLERVFGQLFGNHVDYADLYFQYARSEAWSLEEGIVKSGSFNIEQGVGVRAISGEKTAFAYSDDISLAALQAAAGTTRAIAAAGSQRLAPLLQRRKQPAPLYAGNDPIASLDDAAKVKLLERLEAMARAVDPRVREVMASIAGTWEVVLVARSDGQMAADVRPLVRVSISVIMEEKGRREQG